MIRIIAMSMSLFALILAGCGDDEEPAADKSAPAAESEQAGGVQEYCDLVAKLDRTGDEFFEKLERENASTAEFRQAEKEFVKVIEPDLDELQELAPEEIASDLETLVASVRARGGAGPAVPRKESDAAEKRVQAYEKEHCKG